MKYLYEDQTCDSFRSRRRPSAQRPASLIFHQQEGFEPNGSRYVSDR